MIMYFVALSISLQHKNLVCELRDHKAILNDWVSEKRRDFWIAKMDYCWKAAEGMWKHFRGSHMMYDIQMTPNRSCYNALIVHIGVERS